MSDNLIILLLILYIVILFTCVAEKKYYMALYWLGAIFIVFATRKIK